MSEFIKEAKKNENGELDLDTLMQMRVENKAERNELQRLIVDVGLEKIIVQEIRNRITNGSKDDFKMIVF